MAAKPLDEWKSVWVELMGAEVKIYQGKRWYLRGIEMGDPASPALILLHGTGGHAETYARNIPNLAKHFHVFSMDLLHHGYSQKEPFDAERLTENYVDSLIDFIDTQGLDRPHVEGESLGSEVAFFMGMWHPDKVGKLILNTGAPVRWGPDTGFAGFMDDPAGLKALADRSIAAINNPNPETVRKRLEWLMVTPDRVTDELVDIRLKLYSDPEVQKSVTNVFTTELIDLTPFANYVEEADCAKLKNDSLVFWTEFNPGEGPEVGEYFASLIPGAKFYSMKDSAHWPQWEHPEEHDQVIIDFIQGRL